MGGSNKCWAINILQEMNTEQMINSIYNPKRKTREPFVFPKISKAEPAPPENKIFVRGASRKYNQQNIFKIEDDKKQRVKMHLEQQKIRDLRNREYEQMEAKMAAMARRHQEEMRELEQHEKTITAQIEAAKKNQYDVKYSLWELKNQIMSLNAAYLEHQEEYQRLYQEVGYIMDGGDAEGEGDQLEGPSVQNGEDLQQPQRQPQSAQEQDEDGISGSGRSVTVQLQEAQQQNELRVQYETHSVV